jgi:hypothetical protein
MTKYFILILLTFSVTTFSQTQLDLCSGGSGTTTGVPQSYNEGREADVTVISSSNVGIFSMTLSGFCTGGMQGLVGARIYDSGTHAVLFSRDSIVNPMYNGTVTIPVSFILVSGQSYRVGFYCYGYGSNHNSGSGFMYQPTFPYNESNNLLRINQAYESNPDTFPNNFNIFLPFIKLGYTPLGINEFTVNSSLSIYPNPTSTQFFIDANPEINSGQTTIENLTIELYDISGKHVFSKNVSDKSSIDVSSLNEGIYSLTIKTAGNIMNRKLVILR